MFTRLALGSASLLALAVAAAAPAGAATTSGPDFPTGSEYVCTAPDAGADWRAWVSVTTDGVNGVSDVDYSLKPDARSNFAMPIGSGRIQAASYTEWLDDQRVLHQDRASVPAAERHGCDYPYPSGAYTIRAEVAYLTPPTRPTVAAIVGFCADNADNTGFSEWERANCTSLLTSAAGYAPGTK